MKREYQDYCNKENTTYCWHSIALFKNNKHWSKSIKYSLSPAGFQSRYQWESFRSVTQKMTYNTCKTFNLLNEKALMKVQNISSDAVIP